MKRRNASNSIFSSRAQGQAGIVPVLAGALRNFGTVVEDDAGQARRGFRRGLKFVCWSPGHVTDDCGGTLVGIEIRRGDARTVCNDELDSGILGRQNDNICFCVSGANFRR